jgi:hypothetical protein
MKKHHKPTAKDLGGLKGKQRRAKEAKLRAYLQKHTVSRWMAARAVRMPLQSVCWAIGQLRLMNAVAVVNKGRCTISGRVVEFITTDPDKFPKSKQLNLF